MTTSQGAILAMNEVVHGRRGFAGMSKERQREIASKGGRVAHLKGTAHQFSVSEAREMGRKGGRSAHQRGTAHEFSSDEAREAGRKGGRAAHARTHAAQNPAVAEPSQPISDQENDRVTSGDEQPSPVSGDV